MCIHGQDGDETGCSKERTDVLILNTYSSNNVPILINAAGDVDSDLDFTIDSESEIYVSSSLTWKNDFHVFGSNSKKTQISKVTACRLEKIGELAFPHRLGDCVNVADEKIYICFGDDTKKCRVGSSPTDHFNEITPSLYNHRVTPIATNNGKFN